MFADYKKQNLLLNFFRDLRLVHPLQRSIKPQVLLNSQTIKQNVVLRADAEALSDQIDICSDVIAIDNGSTRGRRKQAG